jgi:raffinose/stachyose/melibiose transport system substrate-binding protein
MIVLTGASAGRTAEGEGEGVTLRLMHIQVAEATKRAVDRAVARFQEATGARVQAEAIKNDQYKQKIAVALPSNDAPDVFHTWGGGVLGGYVDKGLVAPLPEDFPLAGLNPQALAFCKAGDRHYAVPADVSVVVFWYRKSIFEKHGLQPPTTTGELLALCQTLREKQVVPVALGNIEHWPGAFYFDYLVLKSGGAPRYIERSNAAGEPAETPEALVARYLLYGLVDQHAFCEGFNGLDYGQSRAVFFQGEAAMTLMGTWLLSYAISKPEHAGLVDDFGVFPFPPPAHGPESGSVLGGINAAYAVSARSKHPALAFKLLQFLTDEAAAKDWAATGRIPARRVEAADVPAALKEVQRLLDDAPRMQLYFDQALEPAVAEQHKPHTQSMFVTQPPRAWPRLLVGAVAVLILVFVILGLKNVFRSGEGRAG